MDEELKALQWRGTNYVEENLSEDVGRERDIRQSAVTLNNNHINIYYEGTKYKLKFVHALANQKENEFLVHKMFRSRLNNLLRKRQKLLQNTTHQFQNKYIYIHQRQNIHKISRPKNSLHMINHVKT